MNCILAPLLAVTVFGGQPSYQVRAMRAIVLSMTPTGSEAQQLLESRYNFSALYQNRNSLRDRMNDVGKYTARASLKLRLISDYRLDSDTAGETAYALTEGVLAYQNQELTLIAGAYSHHKNYCQWKRQHSS